MLILLLFAFLAGVVTVLSPCVIPILPALLAAGAGKGKSRPLGIIVGVITTFVFFTLFLTAIVHATHLSADFLRYVAIAIIALFGLVMLFPKLGDWFANATSGLANIGQRLQSQSQRINSGFGSGFVLGAALGIVWTPCAGPILAAITTLVATSSVTWDAFLLTLAYSLGSAIPMLLIIYLGKKGVVSSHYAEGIRRIFGGLMILAALAIALHWDVKFQQVAIKYIPLLNIEDNPVVIQELSRLNQNNSDFAKQLKAHEQVKAPDFVGIEAWINSEPLTIEELKGKVVLVDFWTYSCINCIRTLPYLTKWYDTYKDAGLVVVGVHTPEFEFEKLLTNVEDAAKRFGIHYPVALDNERKTWLNYDNIYWPAHYLIDQQGFVRYFHFGEGKYVETENAIRKLLGLAPLHEKEAEVKYKPMTAETYLGFKRAEGYQPEMRLKLGQAVDYSYDQPLKEDHVGLSGKWRVQEERIISAGDHSQLDLNFLASEVYLVMESENEAFITVLLDDKPLPKENNTADMNEKGQLKVKEARKYDIVNLKNDYGRHKISLVTPEGVSMYAFTFGS